MTTMAAATAPDEISRRVCELMRKGWSDRRIARRLGISPDEVRRHVDRIVAKAHLDDRERCARLAAQAGISDGT